MASLSFTQFSLVPRICRWHLNGNPFPYMNLVQIQDRRVNRKVVMAVSRDKLTDSLAQEVSDGEPGSTEKKIRRTSKRASARTRKKVKESPDENPAADGNARDEEILMTSGSEENSRKTRTRTRKKAPSALETVEGEAAEKVTRQRRRKKKADGMDSQGTETEFSDVEGDAFALTMDEDSEQELEFDIDDGEDISFTYGWPPLVCCFGAAQHAFVPAGRQANRLIDYEIHDRKKEALWEPEKFVRASGGCSSNVAVALACLGGKVAFMGKLGDDAFGQSLLYFLNINNVQTRSVRIDNKKATAVSQMKIGKRGGFRMTSVKPCAEDCLSKSEINIDVLKECILKVKLGDTSKLSFSHFFCVHHMLRYMLDVKDYVCTDKQLTIQAKMFYFNTFSLLDRNMRSTTLQAIKIAKKLGNVVFYDLNLPLPLWQSSEETKMFIHKAWDLSDIIEVTKQELEFLCGITPSENFDTRDNDRSKFAHYSPEVVSQLWHDDLKVLFVTNGTSKIHYYTKEHNGAVHGMEDAPLLLILPTFSVLIFSHFSAILTPAMESPELIDFLDLGSGILRMLTLQPHLISDKGYLERTVKYAISCGVIDQWLQARSLGFPAKEGMEDAVPDPNGIKSVTEREYRTLVPSS
ncbi:Fructokinase-like 2, chloroplastic [Sesamum angolense]|uniref:Fructokinase-like 2, chloroplastic n=1 Tax=Sesamum angolense TaxID=2727404 RepID=A0AAE1WLS8_9LAMI|nr:Fructokinase-like 2, chloroplastic [Sesamum angolense]